MSSSSCSCETGTRLIFSCSGASDVGEIADKTARKLTKDQFGKMYCLAGIGGRVSGILKTTEAADEIYVIDGCPLNCAYNSLKLAGIDNINHLQLGNINLIKGSAPVNDETINDVAEKVKQLRI